jgi:ferredoxin
LDHDAEEEEKVKQKIKLKNDCGKGVTCANCGINISGGKTQIKGDC